MATSPNTEIRDMDFGPGFPASLFLDIDWYTWSRARSPPSSLMSVGGSNITLQAVLALLGQENTIVEVSQKYFATIHKWLPMISKKRLDMVLSLHNADPDPAMLFLSMRLVTTPFTHQVDLNPYREAKKFSAPLEENGTISLILLQAIMFIALYEYGHAICSRLDDEPQVENRLLDDDSWDRGEVGKAFGHSTSTPYQTQQSGFARLCQVSISISQAIGFELSGSSAPCIPEITSLVNDPNGFALAVDTENTDWRLEASSSFLSSRALARYALFIALYRFTCPEKMSVEPGYAGEQGTKSQELDFQPQSLLTIEVASRQLHFMATNISPLIPATDGNETQLQASTLVYPFIMDGMYAGAATLHWLCGESGGRLYRAAAADMESLLDTLKSRWWLGSANRELLTV
ncbi:hypothetical protein BDP55DRAFT_688899 [Colletotrichum godetiae]|uniref:Uncharacterized protein n=1 Tax=Colletotrichum godetiae TaxID=1209918 RepID=A0AAJ0F4X5_9PEZI|nr:uncharacterized protein BDP55DRAFT_688899 [Colletotrichum godetiae]KAK1700892.1 hypothetical protein BDP55DRAFT_688899 [Colletotrichum godetiae]